MRPCPFCGGEAEMREGSSTKPYIRCKRCGCRTGSSRYRGNLAKAWNARAERECRFALEEDREMLAEKAACGPGEFVTQDMPDLLWTCSACGEQYRNGFDALPGWLKHCPNCGAKIEVMKG